MSNFMWIFTAVIVLFALIGTILVYIDNKKHNHLTNHSA